MVSGNCECVTSGLKINTTLKHPIGFGTLMTDGTHIRMNSNVVAINSAIEIDITGQVCADSIGTHMYRSVYKLFFWKILIYYFELISKLGLKSISN